jgi:predicted Zn-dependent protease
MNRSRGGFRGKLIIAAIIALFSIISYFSSRQYNEVTNEVQHVAITPNQEIALGLQATPEMTQQYGGEIQNEQVKSRVSSVGNRIVEKGIGKQTPYQFNFHVLADPKTINAFALPGGQVFITQGLLKRLTSEGEIAGVLGHEIGHVVARHGAQHIAKQRLTQGLTGAAVIATYDPNNSRSRNTAAMAILVGQLVNLRYGREDELQSDELGVRFMANAGYDPRSMLKVMQILKKASEGNAPPEFFSTHPNPDNRLEHINSAIKKQFPEGVPPGLQQ